MFTVGKSYEIYVAATISIVKNRTGREAEVASMPSHITCMYTLLADLHVLCRLIKTIGSL